jgi:hypothetical protein
VTPGIQGARPLLKSIRPETAPLWANRLAMGRVPWRRSVIFIRHSYYHFFYLAQALRRRGWDALCVSLEHPQGPFSAYYHGEDINLHAEDHERQHANIRALFEMAKSRFRLMHFAGDGCLSFFPEHFIKDDPPDIVEWRALGRGIAYTVSGCNSGVSQSAVAHWSQSTGGASVCDKCVWQHRPEICTDQRNLAWGRKFDRFCDIVFSEVTPALDHVRASEKVIREPVTTALDPHLWQPGLTIPEPLRIAREPSEVLVYHGVGNYDMRSAGGRNIKGTPAVMAAVDRLRGEGRKVRLIFRTGMKNFDVRYVQAQCDIIVDQLNYGRYGATAREGMMLGRPVICYLNVHELDAADELDCLKEVPLISATEESLYLRLKELIDDAPRRAAIGAASREYALKWHNADACALRYEKVYDRLMGARPALRDPPR